MMSDLRNNTTAAVVIIILLAGGLGATWIGYSKKKKEAANTAVLLAETEKRLSGNIDSLQGVLINRDAKYQVLETNYSDKVNELEKSKDRNVVLASSVNKTKKDLARTTEELKGANNSLTDMKRINADQTAKNEALEKDLSGLKDKLASKDEESALRATQLATAEKKMLADSLQCESDKDMLAAQIPVEGRVIFAEALGGYGLGGTTTSYSRWLGGINSVIGYRFDERISAGLGLGAFRYEEGFLLPLYLDFRYNFKGKKTAPIFIADGGLLLSPDGIISTRLFIHPSFGLRKDLTEKLSLYGAVGPYIQMCGTDGRASFITLRFGAAFKK